MVPDKEKLVRVHLEQQAAALLGGGVGEPRPYVGRQPSRTYASTAAAWAASTGL